ncbi:ABC transporter ATP-binding protein [Longitalea arenae]|uniref:ABC transporter ATP-binding protein n=1 Tax=Longitalea arenae TaxID=2812558 RepID=UPI001967DCBC|nr:ABC transporter ATP-binding protein [Longitalea arenae]
MSDIVIKVEGLSKQYRLGQIGTGSLAHDINRLWYKLRGKEDPYLKVGEENDRTKKAESDYVWALRDVNFDIKQGEVVGIIGRNGAGKSSLLKILSRTTSPTTGQVKLKGRIASLLEVGTGFHPELSGRENIFLNGAILGMTKSEIKSKFDEIVAFSGVERYIDTPVKRYSSGMYVRLAFAVAAHLQSEILIVDEVLAVGDAEFQKKCLGKMKDVSTQQGRTVLFVSHNMGAVRGLCTMGILMQHGKVEQQGPVNNVIAKYLINPSAVFNNILKDPNDSIVIESVAFKNSAGESTQNYKIGDDLILEINYFAKDRFEQPYFWIGVESQFGSLFGANMLIDGKRPAEVNGKGTIACRFKNLPLMPQTYSVWIGARASDGRTGLTKAKEVGFFNIVSNIQDLSAAESDHAEILANDSTPVIINYEWQMPDGKTIPVNLFN